MSNAPKRHLLGKENTKIYKPHEHVNSIYIIIIIIRLYYNLIYFSEKINFVVVCCCCFTSLDLRARFHFECIQLCISRILFQVSKTELFLLRLFDYKLNFCCEF